jgi:D-alanyl-lipoteichoic acid acyltransferase DltB (MBOAT superfamily)
MSLAHPMATLGHAWTTLSQSLLVTGTTLLASRAGLFLRVLGASLAYIAVAALARWLLAPAHRAWALVATSVVLLAVLATPLLAAAAVVYFLAFYALVERCPRGPARTIAVIGVVAFQTAVPIWWLSALPGVTLLVRELVAFTTNMTQLRCWAYAWDRSHDDAPAPGLRDYAHYMTFFPSFVGGPLLSFAEFQRGHLDWFWASTTPPRLADPFRTEWHAGVRIAIGVVAGVCAIQFVPVLAPKAYLDAATGPVAAWSHAIAVYLAVYLGFSAWSEAAIGSARLCGIVLPENFDHAHLSYGIADFWRRWNIRLGWWMREYIYLPLGGNRRRLWRNTTAVFLATAVYHHLGGLKLLGPALIGSFDFYLGWLGWAALNTVGTLATRHLRRPATLGPREIAVIVTTTPLQLRRAADRLLPRRPRLAEARRDLSGALFRAGSSLMGGFPTALSPVPERVREVAHVQGERPAVTVRRGLRHRCSSKRGACPVDDVAPLVGGRRYASCGGIAVGRASARRPSGCQEPVRASRRRARSARTAIALQPATLAIAPSVTLAGRYSKRTRCVPAGARTPRNRWFTATIGAGAPSSVARQPG